MLIPRRKRTADQPSCRRGKDSYYPPKGQLSLYIRYGVMVKQLAAVGRDERIAGCQAVKL